MEKTVFTYAVRRIKPIMILFSVLVLLRGHNEPGGGFIGGLIAGSAYIMEALAYGPYKIREKLPLRPSVFMALGLSFALLSSAPSIIKDGEFMTGVWFQIPLPGGEYFKAGTPLLFDVGVYFVVIGFTLSVILTLMEAWKWK